MGPTAFLEVPPPPLMECSLLALPANAPLTLSMPLFTLSMPPLDVPKIRHRVYATQLKESPGRITLLACQDGILNLERLTNVLCKWERGLSVHSP